MLTALYISVRLLHRNMNSIEGAMLLTMQRPENSQKKEDIM